MRMRMGVCGYACACGRETQGRVIDTFSSVSSELSLILSSSQDQSVLMIILLLFLQKQNLALAVYLFGIGTLLTGLGSKKRTHVIMFSP